MSDTNEQNANAPLVITPAVLQQIITDAVKAAQPLPDPAVEAKRAAEKAERLEMQRVAGEQAKAADAEKAAIRKRCNHRQGSSFEADKLGKNHLTQGRSPDSALVLNRGSRWPHDLSDSFIICQHCTTTIMPGSPDWDAAFEVCS